MWVLMGPWWGPIEVVGGAHVGPLWGPAGAHNGTQMGHCWGPSGPLVGSLIDAAESPGIHISFTLLSHFFLVGVI